MKPLLLIDVDGVLNPFDAYYCPEGYTEHRILGYRCRVNPEHGQWLTDLGEYFELTWGTAWQHHANAEWSPRLGLPQLPVCEFTVPIGGSRFSSGSWKLPDIKRYVGDRPFAWIDDDINADAYEWATEREIPSLLVLTNPAKGMQPHHVMALREWAQELP